MTQWIENTNTKQDGTPVTKNIKIPEMSEEIFFTTNAYAEVSDSVADILSGNIDEIIEVSEPSDPGTYYGDAAENTTIVVNIEDGAFNDISVTGKTTTQSLDTGQASIGGTETQPTVEETETHVDAGFVETGAQQNGANHGLNLASGSRFHSSTLYREGSEQTFTSFGEVVDSFLVGPFHHPPGTIPILVTQAEVKCDTVGENVGINVKWPNMRSPAPETPTSGTGGDSTTYSRHYDETYMADAFDNHSTSVKKAFPKAEITGVLGGGATQGTIRNVTVSLYLEVR